MNDKATLPRDIEVEQALIGALILDPEKSVIVRQWLRADHFFEPLHGRMFAALCTMIDAGKQVTPLMLNAAMKGDGALTEVGGHRYLAGLADAAPSLPNLRELSRVLIELSIRRDVIRAGEDCIVDAQRGAGDMPTALLLARASQDIEVAVDEWMRASGTARGSSVQEIGWETLREAEEVARGKPTPRVRTGSDKIDGELGGGLRGGDLMLIPGRPGHGKSAVLASIALAAASPRLDVAGVEIEAGVPVIFFSLEMTQGQLTDRMVAEIDYRIRGSNQKPLRYSTLRDRVFTPEVFDRYGVAVSHLPPNLHIDDADSLTMEDIAARARAFKARFPNAPIGLVVIDYLQIVKAFGRADTREQEVSAIARGAKALAKRLGWPVVAGCQLSRQVDNRPEKDRRPQVADIRESGSLEQEADAILACYRRAAYVLQRRPPPYATQEEFAAWQSEFSTYEHVLEMVGLKHRHGRVFDVGLWCDMASNVIADDEPSAKVIDDAKGLLV